MFSTKAHGKWILTGEHAVLRGYPGLVFPLKKISFILTFTPSDKPFELKLVSNSEKQVRLCFLGCLNEALLNISRTTKELNGQIKIVSSIPMGAGLGSSSAMCAAISQLLAHLNWIAADEVFTFARNLEDNFHGKSSGIDIAGAMSTQGVYYQMGKTPEAIAAQWSPLLYLSFSDRLSMTGSCVKKVQQHLNDNPNVFEKIDKQMAISAKLCLQALKSSKTQGLPLLISGINQGNECFKKWGLINGNLKTHLEFLQSQGAKATKPIGAGDGGYVLSLWDTPPSEDLLDKLTQVFVT